LILVLTVLAPRWGRDARDREAARLAQLGRARVTGPATGKAPSETFPVLWGGSEVRFAGGSMVRFLPDGHGRIAESSADRARVVLEQGALYAHVVHRSGTSWLVHAGAFVVRVTGTTFRAGWDPARGQFEIAMSEGAVTVEGPKFSQRVAAGQTLVATVAAGIVRLGPNDATAAAALAALDQVGQVTAPGSSSNAAAPAGNNTGNGTGGNARRAGAADEGHSASARRRAPSRSRGSAHLAVTESSAEASWSRRLSTGGFRDVLAEAKLLGLDKVVARRGLDDLAALATAARLSGDNDVARRALGAQRSRFPGTAAAAEAAFLLGRMAEDVDRNPAAAALWYERCLEEAPVGDLAAEALGRQLGVMVAVPLARPRPVVRAAARRYLDRFPDGPHAAQARALLDSEPAVSSK
jgi:hypothetical protein